MVTRSRLHFALLTPVSLCTKSPSVKLFFSITVSCLTLLAIIWTTWPLRFGLGDGIAQFLPASLMGTEAYLHLDLPLYNWYQLLGVPLMGTGYYPVADPIFLLSAIAASSFLNQPQLTWDITFSVYFYIASISSSFLLLKVFNIQWVLAIVGGISWAFSGSAIFFAGEWLYMQSVFFWIPTILFLTDRWVRTANYSFGFLISVSFFIFLISSNVQIFFYSLHFLLLGFIVIFTLRENRKTQLIHFSLLTIMIVSLSIGYITLLIYTSLDSIREVGKVPIDKYYWLQLNWRSVLNYSFLPFKSGWNFTETKGMYFQGPFVIAGILISPLCFLFMKPKEFIVAITLISGVAIFFLLSIGSSGHIGGLLYNLSPYNAFRHSIKWAPLFHMSSVLLGIFVIDRLIKKLQIKLIVSIFFTINMVCYLYFVSTWDNLNSKRFTEITLPIKFDTTNLNSQYRITGLWDNGDAYKDYPLALLGSNFSSYFRLFQISGYEPLIPRRNMEHILGNWHPGWYISLNDFPLDKFSKFGLKWVLIPKIQYQKVKDFLQEKYPTFRLLDGGTRDTIPPVSTLIIDNVAPLVFIANSKGEVGSFEVKGNSIFAKIVEADEGGELVFCWVANPDFYVYLNGKIIPWTTDDHGRVLVKLPQLTSASVELRYFPRIPFIFMMVGILIFALSSIIYHNLGNKRWLQRPPKYLGRQ